MRTLLPPLAVNWHASDVTWSVDRQIELQRNSLSLPLNASTVFHLGHDHARPYLVVQLDPSIKVSVCLAFSFAPSAFLLSAVIR